MNIEVVHVIDRHLIYELLHISDYIIDINK